MQELSRFTRLTAIRGKSEVTTSSLQGLSALPQLGCLFLDELKLVDDAGQPCTAPLFHSTALTRLGNMVIPTEVLSDRPNDTLHVPDAAVNGAVLWANFARSCTIVMQVLMLHVATLAGIPHVGCAIF